MRRNMRRKRSGIPNGPHRSFTPAGSIKFTFNHQEGLQPGQRMQKSISGDFALIVFTTNLLLADYAVAVSSFMLATVAALLVGKAVLVANAMPYLRRYDRAPFDRRGGRLLRQDV
jgi:hypothetical protein